MSHFLWIIVKNDSVSRVLGRCGEDSWCEGRESFVKMMFVFRCSVQFLKGKETSVFGKNLFKDGKFFCGEGRFEKSGVEVGASQIR